LYKEDHAFILFAGGFVIESHGNPGIQNVDKLGKENEKGKGLGIGGAPVVSLYRALRTLTSWGVRRVSATIT